MAAPGAAAMAADALAPTAAGSTAAAGSTPAAGGHATGAGGRARRIDAPGRVAIRQASPTDYEGLRDFLAGLSLRTRYLRFFAGVGPVTPAMLRRLIGGATPGRYVDVLVAIEDGAVIGHGMSSDDTGTSGERVTEMGVVVTDTRQGRGIGTALMRALAGRARARGATAVMMDVLAENQRMLAMIDKQLPAARQDRSGPYVTVRAPLPRPQEEPPRGPLSRTEHPQRDHQPRQPRQPGQLRRPAQPGQPGQPGQPAKPESAGPSQPGGPGGPGCGRQRRVAGRAAAGLPVGGSLGVGGGST